MHTHHSHRHHNQLSLFQKAKELPNRHVSVAAYSGESHMLRTLSVMLALCIVLYSYFVGVSILNVIGSREATVESTRLQSVVGNLEGEYFELSQSITPASGARLGLSGVQHEAYIRPERNVATNVTHNNI